MEGKKDVRAQPLYVDAVLRGAAAVVSAAALAWGCASPAPSALDPAIATEMQKAAERKAAAPPAALDRALLPPMTSGMPNLPGLALDLEPRFDLSVNSAP